MKKYIIGIDEVGRGCLAGPVCVAAVAIQVGSRCLPAITSVTAGEVTGGRKFGKLKDSKQLSIKQREGWAKFLKALPGIKFAVSSVSPRVIDKINITRAANRAALSVFEKLLKTCRVPAVSLSNLLPGTCRILLDGGLFCGNEFVSRGAKRPGVTGFSFRTKSGKVFTAQTIIKGDEKIPEISAASIIAKVHRDRLMAHLAKKYPAYGFEVHKGYGTASHRLALKKLGPSKIHRMTFLKFFSMIPL